MDRALETFKIGCWIIAFIVYTLSIYGAGFTAGWYKGVSDTLVPMFFEQTQQTESATNPAPQRPTSPIQFPQSNRNSKNTATQEK